MPNLARQRFRHLWRKSFARFRRTTRIRWVLTLAGKRVRPQGYRGLKSGTAKLPFSLKNSGGDTALAEDSLPGGPPSNLPGWSARSVVGLQAGPILP
jgi:hypothetical protein